MKRIYKTLAIIGATAALVSCGGNKTKTAETETVDEVNRISVAEAVMQDVPQSEVYSSTVEAFAVNNIAPQTGGRIDNIKVDVGDFVSKGQILAIMDAAQLDQTRMKLQNDSTELGRLNSLYRQGGVSKSDYDAAEMAYNVSKRAYDNLLENTLLRSPLNGVVSARNYDKGDMYSGQPIYVVEQITPVKLLVGISEIDYTKVKKGDKVKITADALPGQEFTGTVNKIYPTIDPKTHTFTTEIIVPNGDKALRPGMFARVSVEFGVNHSVVIPDVAVVKQQGSSVRIVYVVQPDSTVKSTVVTLGRHFGTSYEVLNGLNEGDQVAAKGSTSLRDGDKVEVISSND
ncbi:MAG: efflux RND transporter periplasmic adaptor subunit [Bacteroidales bacterium]|nr:efflux RND transporter periplasmic adaptor subunit [Bacteroidales bacterium]